MRPLPSRYRRYAIADKAALEEGVSKLAELHGAGSKRRRKVIALDDARGK